MRTKRVGRKGAVPGRIGRGLYPLGQEIEGLPFRAPPGLLSSQTWPPTVEEARKALSDVLGKDRDRTTGKEWRRNQGGRGLTRSGLATFTLGGALAARAYIAPDGRGRFEDLVEAFSMFNRASRIKDRSDHASYRAAALFNATACLQFLPTSAARGLSATLLVSSIEAIGDEYLKHFRDALAKLGDKVQSMDQPAPLRWKGRLLVPDHALAEKRIRERSPSVEGSWTGCRNALMSVGLEAPVDCRVPAMALMIRKNGEASLLVSPA